MTYFLDNYPITVRLWPFFEQLTIVRRFDALFGVRLRLSVVVAGHWCERLTQAVLGKAFAGRL